MKNWGLQSMAKSGILPVRLNPSGKTSRGFVFSGHNPVFTTLSIEYFGVKTPTLGFCRNGQPPDLPLGFSRPKCSLESAFLRLWSFTVKEIWKPIPEFEGYEISNFGRVRSFKKKQSDNEWVISDNPQRVLKAGTKPTGYKFVNLSRGGTQHNFNIHKLVMAVFIGPCPDDMEVCHNDGDPSNNRLDNLRYDTHQSNMQDAASIGKAGSLTGSQARAIRNAHKKGVSRTDLMRKYNISYDVLGCVLRGDTYTIAGGSLAHHRESLDERAKNIRTEYAKGGVTLMNLANKFGLSESSISRIVNGRLCKDASGPVKGKDY